MSSNTSSHKEKEIAHKVEDTLTNAADTLSTTVRGVTKGVKQAANEMKLDSKKE